MITPLLAYGAGLGSAAAYYRRDWLRQQYQAVMDKALASHDPKAIAKVAVAFGAVGMPAQAAALQGRARSLTGTATAGAAGTPNVLQNPSRMMPGETLQPQLSKQNQSVGRDQRGILTFQTDGNLVLYGPGQTVLWASNTGPKTGVSKLTMQSDGNLVIYGNNGQALWSSGTQGNAGAFLTVQGGQAAITGPQGQVIWSVPSGAAGAQAGMPGMPGMGMPGQRGGRGRHQGRGGGGWGQQQAWQQQGQQGQYPHHHHHHHHPGQQQQAQQSAPAASDGGGNGGGGGGASDAASSSPPPPPPPASPDTPDVSAASMISPAVATDSGGASDASLDTPPDDSDVSAPTADAGFGFGFGGFG